jgi:hypothetical protein
MKILLLNHTLNLDIKNYYYNRKNDIILDTIGINEKKMKVYRIEDKNGNGYKVDLDSQISNSTDEGFCGKHMQDEDTYAEFRPLPHNDGIKSSLIRKYHLFAFESLDSLNSWFLPADLVMGNLLGGKLCVYEVNEKTLIKGGKQVVFDKRKAVLINTFSMSHFLNDDIKNNLFDFKQVIIENVEMEMEIFPELKFLL